jgi:hypothetical protein
MGEKTGVCSVLVGKREGKRPLGRRKNRREENVKIEVKERGRWRNGRD